MATIQTTATGSQAGAAPSPSRRGASPVRRALAVVGVLISTWALFYLALTIAPLAALPLFWVAGEPTALVFVHLSTSVIALAFVWIWHRKRGRALWSEVGVSINRRTAGHFAAGMGIAALATVAMSIVPVLSGTATFNTSEQMTQWFIGIPAILTTAFLLQAIPEELLFRGQMQKRLHRWIGDAGVIAVSTLGFGLMHVISLGPANALEQANLIAVVVGWAFTCAVARYLTGSIWMAVGIHGGFHIWKGSLIDQGAQLYDHFGSVPGVVAYIAVGCAMLFIAKRTRAKQDSVQVLAGTSRL